MGPITQFKNNDKLKTFRLLNTSFNLLYLTFVKGGYIINISPTANGILVVPLENEFIIFDTLGLKYPIPIPINMAKNIHRVKYLSKKLNFFLSCVGAHLFADIDFILVFF
jgi:hypothetical protein